MPVNGKPNGRFELPALAPLNFNLTEGTNIPPPPKSPVEDAPPAPSESAPTQATPTIVTNGQIKEAAGTNGDFESRGRTSAIDRPPLSPASSTRPSSIRRFLSRKSLNANYTTGTNTNTSTEDLTGVGRPDSPSSFIDGKPKPKRNGSWFRRLGSSNRQSVIYENNSIEEKKVAKGPPPPTLPELNQLKSKVSENDKGSFGGDDMFKNIK
jgi:hypothetical protein